MTISVRGEDSGTLEARLRPRLVEAYGRWEAASGTAYEREDWYHLLIDAAQKESSTVEQVVAICEFALASDKVCAARQRSQWTEAALLAWADVCTEDVLLRCLQTLEPEHLATPDTAAQYFQELRRYFRETADVRGQRIMSAVRAVLTGAMIGPCLGIVASLLGWQRCIDRIRGGLP